MIIIYDFDKLLKDHKLNKAKLAREIGVSKQLLGYHLSKGDINLSYLTSMAESMQMPIEELTKLLNDKYVKRKI